MKTLYFLMISLLFIGCKGKIPKVGKNPKSNFKNNASPAAVANSIYRKIFDSDDDKNNAKINNSSKIHNLGYFGPSKTNYKPSLDHLKIKPEAIIYKVPRTKKPNFKLHDYNSKEYQDRMIKLRMELDKINKAETPIYKVPKTKNPNFKLKDYNSKELNEKMIKLRIELAKIKNQ